MLVKCYFSSDLSMINWTSKMYEIENLWYYLGDYDRLSNKCMFLFKHNLVKNIPIELSKSKFLIKRIHSPYWQVGVIKEFIESLDLPASLDWNFFVIFTHTFTVAELYI